MSTSISAKKGDRDMNTEMNAPPAPAPLSPIPRTGLHGSSGILLYICLLLSTILVGIGNGTAVTATVGVLNLCEGIALVSTILLMFYLWRVTRTSKGILPVLVIFGVFLTYMTGSIMTAAVLLGLIFTISEGSFLLAVLPKKQLGWIPLLPIAAYAVILALSRDPLGALAVLVPYPPMIVLALSTRNSAEKENGLTRVGVICATALTLGLSLAALLALAVYNQLGTLDPAVLQEALESFRTALIDEIAAIEIPEGLNAEALAELEEALSYANVTNAVNSVFNLLPAMAVVAVNLIATTAQLLQHASLRAFGFGDSITERVRSFRMSLISCVVFLIAYLVALAEGTHASTLVGTVAQNVYIILLPGLAWAGVLRLMSSLVRKGGRGMGCMFFLIILIPCLFLSAPFVFAAIEVIGHIFTSITSAIKPPSDDDDMFGNPPKDS